MTFKETFVIAGTATELTFSYFTGEENQRTVIMIEGVGKPAFMHYDTHEDGIKFLTAAAPELMAIEDEIGGTIEEHDQ